MFVKTAALIAILGAAPAAPEVRRSDDTTIHYELNLANGVSAPRGVLLMLQGSGCAPVTGGERFSGWERIAPDFALLTIEKAGVVPGDEPPSSDADGDPACSAAFYANDTLDRRVLDAARVIQVLRGQDWWTGELIVFGGSEGGAVAAELAGMLPGLDAVVIFSTSLGWTLEEAVLGSVPPPVREPIAGSFAEARAGGGFEPVIAGHSPQWWANALDRRPAAALSTTQSPVLIVHGALDQFAPVASAREGVDLLENAGTCVTYLEKEGLDHFMRDAEGADQRPAVFTEIGQWVEAALNGAACR